jgi:hypothetical protein
VFVARAGRVWQRHPALMLLASFIAMFALMYAMTNRLEDVYVNWNQAYMAAPSRTIPCVQVWLSRDQL